MGLLGWLFIHGSISMIVTSLAYLLSSPRQQRGHGWMMVFVISLVGQTVFFPIPPPLQSDTAPEDAIVIRETEHDIMVSECRACWLEWDKTIAGYDRLREECKAFSFDYLKWCGCSPADPSGPHTGNGCD